MLLEKLCNANAISGREKVIYNILKNELKNDVDEIISDKLGSFISKKGNKGLKVMLAAHMDEVGFIVKRIDDNGYIYFQPVGGWWPQVLLAQQVIITTYNDKEIFGFIGCKPPHVLKVEKRKEMVQIEDMFIDLGVSSKEEVLDLGIQIGDMITPKTNFRKMNNDKYLFGKAMDNRIGCTIVVDVMKKLNNPTNQIYGVATVQEEIGLRGATTCANLINPDIAIAIDTSIAGDTPKMTEDEASAKIGEGPVLIVMDATTLGTGTLRNEIIAIAKKNNIKVQTDFTPGGGTDAGRMHLAHDGAPVISMAIATRYIHSHGSIIHEDDYNNCVNLIVNFINELNSDMYERILKG